MPPVHDKFDITRIKNELQQIIIGGLGELDLQSIPDDVPILDLGISSLALVDGMRQVYDRFGVLVSIRRVIEGQITLGTLALHIEQELNLQHPLRKKSQPAQWKVERQIPLAPSQQHLAFLSRYSNEANAAFNEALILRLSGTLHGPALHAAIEEAGRRFESLRTALDSEQNALNIGTGEALELVVSVITSDQLHAKLTEVVARPFEAGRRLFRAELLRLSETEHALVLVGHALVLEQHGLKIVLKDIAELYRLYSHDQPPSHPPLILQWTDYFALGDTEKAKETQRLAKEYWTDVFASGVPRLELPTDHQRPPIKKYSGSRMDLKLDPAIQEQLQTFAASEGLSLESVILAAFSIFIHRVSALDDIVIGVESGGLYFDGLVSAVAELSNVLPARSKYDLSEAFRDYVHANAKALADADKYRNLSLAELIQLLQLPRDQSRSALFTAAFRSQKDDDVQIIFDNLQSDLIPPPSPGARYDIELIARFASTPSPGDNLEDAGIHLTCEFSTELFESETISRWLNGIAALLESGLHSPDQRCGSLPIMPPVERDMIISDWNMTDKDYPRMKTVLDLIMEQAEAAREAVAIQFGDESLGYGQLIERVDQIASALHQNGVEHGDHVGILMKRSLDLIPSLLAVWRLGALLVPMDISFPKNRIAYMLEDSGVHTVITDTGNAILVEGENNPRILYVENVNAVIDLDNIKTAKGSDSAYIMYTSGSTGKPKGVEIRHASLLNCLLATKEYLDIKPGSRMLALTTVSFDISTNELLMPLISGGCVELGEDGLVADGIQLKERIEKSKPSHVQATPSTWKAVLIAGLDGYKNLCLIATGEALNRELAEQLLQNCYVLWNLYGPTETTVFSSAHRVQSKPHKPMRIGRPLPNTQMYILDKQLQPLPVGAIGDLYIAGDGVAVGYWNRPELTNERFIENPFRPGEGMYFTGDLARHLPDGTIICLGRVDDQVKIHGVRIELGEVESALRSIEGVRDAVVVAWKDARGDPQLVAHVLATKEFTAYEIRAHLRESLPEVMVPPYILFTESFPQTANGKVHRAALPAPSPSPSSHLPAGRGDDPFTSTEKMLAQAWANVLGIDANIIGCDSDFFDLGGHSLLITLLMIEVRKSFQVNFNLREFFANSSLQKFAKFIDERRQPDSNQPYIGRAPASNRTSEWARQRMAFLQREAELPRYLAPARGLSYQPVEEIQNVLLTGGTGFLGAYVVAEILKTTNASVHCLVRPRRGEDGRQRIEKQMKRYQLWAEEEAWRSAWQNRLHVVDGDVTLPRLGMKDAEYDYLSRVVDAIFHGAAHVNFIYPYEALRATNVLGVHEIIQFAFHGRIKPVHHLSTAAIWPMGAQYTYFEKDAIDHVGLLNLGYDEAKWVGEKCMVHAEERGLPVARYRPGEVGGDSVTGRCVTDHFLIACFKGFLQFGAFPDLDIEIDVAPVDYVAKSMVYMAFHRNVLGQAFHLTNPSRRRLKDGLAYLRDAGYRFEELPFIELRDHLVNSPGFSSNALFAYQAALDDMDEVSMQLPTYDTRETQRELVGSGITCPPADEKLFGTYLGYLQGIGFLPQPDELRMKIPSKAGQS